MGFFARLKWLLVGEGEAPSSFKSTPAAHPSRRHEGHPRGQTQSRDRDSRNSRDRDSRDNRVDRSDRFNRDNRGSQSRDTRESRTERDRDRQAPRSGGYNREGGDRYSERDRGNGSRRQGGQNGGASRRDSFGSDSSLPRQVERPTGGPSSTMRPAQSSMAEVAVAPLPSRPAQQGPEKVGSVVHYYDDARVASIVIEKGLIRSGDWIELQGNISSLRQKVDSMQLDGEPIQEAHEGQTVGIRVIRPVKAGDGVVRLRG